MTFGSYANLKHANSKNDFFAKIFAQLKKKQYLCTRFCVMSENDHYIIDLKRLPIGCHSFDITLDDAFFRSLEKTEVLSGNVVGKATLNLREEDYQLNIAVQGTVFVVCDRCLDPMPLEIEASEEVTDEGLPVTGDPITHNPSPVTLDLSWLAYEIVSINIPIVHCHQPGECNKQMELLLHDHLCDDLEPDEIND